MIRAVGRIVAWLAVGGGVLATSYWLFLNIPESNALVLSASAILVVAMIVVAAITINGALLLANGGDSLSSLRRAAVGIPAFLIAALPVLIVWVAVLMVDRWIVQHSGEISAWFIARFGWSKIEPLFVAQQWLSRWIRWLVAPLAAFRLLSMLLENGVRSITHGGWVRRAWHWRTLAIGTAVFLRMLVSPWRLTLWRPRLPATWMEPAIAGLRLVAVALLGLIGSALLISLAVKKSD